MRPQDPVCIFVLRHALRTNDRSAIFFFLLLSSLRLLTLWRAPEQAYFPDGMPDVVMVGRLRGCDLMMPGDLTTVSRLHAVIFALPRHARIVVIDVGSFSGVCTMWRSGRSGGTAGGGARSCTTSTTTTPAQLCSVEKTDLLQRSVPHARVPLQFYWGESVVLQLGSRFLRMSPCAAPAPLPTSDTRAAGTVSASLVASHVPAVVPTPSVAHASAQ
jgi:hypothetical protein